MVSYHVVFKMRNKYKYVNEILGYDAYTEIKKQIADFEYELKFANVKKEDVVAVEIYKDYDGEIDDWERAGKNLNDFDFSKSIFDSYKVDTGMNDYNYYKFYISFSTPYEYKIGYRHASDYDIKYNEDAIDNLKDYLGWKSSENNDCGEVPNRTISIRTMDSYFRKFFNPNDNMEKIAVCEDTVSGCAKKKTIENIVEYFNDLDTDIILNDFISKNILGVKIIKTI